MWSLMQGRVIAIYNAPYDLARIAESARAHGFALPAMESMCVIALYAQFHGEKRYGGGYYTSKKLEIACQRFGIAQGNAHNAAADARYAYLVLAAMAKLADERGIPEEV